MIWYENPRIARFGLAVPDLSTRGFQSSENPTVTSSDSLLKLLTRICVWEGQKKRWHIDILETGNSGWNRITVWYKILSENMEFFFAPHTGNPYWTESDRKLMNIHGFFRSDENCKDFKPLPNKILAVWQTEWKIFDLLTFSDPSMLCLTIIIINANQGLKTSELTKTEGCQTAWSDRFYNRLILHGWIQPLIRIVNI